MISPGQSAYEAFQDEFTGRLLKWDELSEKTQVAWDHIAYKVIANQEEFEKTVQTVYQNLSS